MKAKYIMEALNAMKHAEEVLLHRPDNSTDTFNAYKRLLDARCELKVFSCIGDMEVPVEKEDA